MIVVSLYFSNFEFVNSACSSAKMATTRIRNETWKNDDALKNAFIKYIRQGLQRKEILDFIQRDFSEYAWSLRTLDRRIKYFFLLHHGCDVIFDLHNGLTLPGYF